MKKPVLKKTTFGGANLYLGNIRIASVQENRLTKSPKFYVHTFIPSPIMENKTEENWGLPKSAETLEEGIEVLKQFVTKLKEEIE